MSDLNEEYMHASIQGKLEILSTIYNMASTTPEEKDLIRPMAQKLYDQLKGRDSKKFLLEMISMHQNCEGK